MTGIEMKNLRVMHSAHTSALPAMAAVGLRPWSNIGAILEPWVRIRSDAFFKGEDESARARQPPKSLGFLVPLSRPHTYVVARMRINNPAVHRAIDPNSAHDRNGLASDRLARLDEHFLAKSSYIS